jgi:hypothetical protein
MGCLSSGNLKEKLDNSLNLQCYAYYSRRANAVSLGFPLWFLVGENFAVELHRVWMKNKLQTKHLPLLFD